MNKTKQIKVLQGNYGYGWDDLAYYDKPYNLKEMMQEMNDYLNNQPNYCFRIITRRVAL